jgi:hypothetical protein
MLSLRTGSGGASAASSYTVSREFLVYYYPWFNLNAQKTSGAHWGQIDWSNKSCTGALYWPSQGPYDCTVQATLTEQLNHMQIAGVTGILISWWGKSPNETDVVSKLLISTAAAIGMKFAFTVPQLNGLSARTILSYLLQTYGKSPNWLRVNGQPAFFIDNSAWSGGGKDIGWQSAGAYAANQTGITPWLASSYLAANGYRQGEIAGTVHAGYRYVTAADFSPSNGITTLDQIQAHAPSYYATQMQAQGDLVSIAVVFPRHNGTRVHSGVQGLVVDGYGGQTMLATLNAATAPAANPDWIVVVSWNEWGEGSMLEASLQFGNDSFYPEIVKAFLQRPAKIHKVT